MMATVVDRAETLKALRAHWSFLVREFDVRSLALFGSVARDEASADSDVDILVIFDGPATSARYFGLQFYLKDLLGRPVDLVTDKALRPELRPYVEAEAVYV
ncbi:nucleotidyltransferase family protein [Alloalcanivorax mobilis]|uniref:nucleotidyltransferase family protein n=1 Tax=Alloalcanivorax mobilis TaxID=2019569 RepID=UPI001E373B2D|nr:nucleotidyltransferase family protein [Alloalcanivorax mobilis]